jgi:hypothetical protein
MSRRRASAWSAAALGAAILAGCGDADDGPAAASTATAPTVKATVVSTTPKPRPKRPHFDTIDSALEYIAKRVDVPVAVPGNLPNGVTVAGVYTSRHAAQLTLRIPGPRGLTIEYGEAGFDGCGPSKPRVVMVGSNPAVLNEPDPPGKGRIYRTLVWPATLKDLNGRYGLSGYFSAKQMLAFAASMERARAAAPRGPKTNC